MALSSDKQVSPARAVDAAGGSVSGRTGGAVGDRRWLSIVGIGEDGVAGLGEAAREAISGAAHVFGGRRHLALADDLIRGEAHPWPVPFDPSMADVVALKGQQVCVLASGDPFHYGVGVSLARVIGPDQMICHPVPSSFALAAARLGWALQAVDCLSLHVAPVASLRRFLHPGRNLLILTSGARGPADIAGYLVAGGFGTSTISVLEALGGPDEQIRSCRAAEFDLPDIHPLNVVALQVAVDGEGARVLPLSAGLPEDWFGHDGQITKRDVRAVTLAALAPRAGELLWDIGAGSGSVAIEWLLAHPSMRAIAIEAHRERAAAIRANGASFGVSQQLQVVQACARDGLDGLAQPDAIFVGGGGTQAGVMDEAMAALAPGGRLVANGVTLEMELRLIDCHKRHGGRLIRLAVSEAAPLGGMTTWRPALPLTQWSWIKPAVAP